MASENVVASDMYGAAIAAASGQVEACPNPSFAAQFECWGPGSDGKPELVWSQPWHNIVVDQGRALVLNKVFANGFANHTNQFLFLHSITSAPNSAHTWGNVSAAQVGGYSANIPRITFSTVSTDSTQGLNSLTATAGYSFTAAGPSTVGGAGILFYTATSMATNFATSDGRLYCYGLFPASQQVQSNNSLSVSVSVSFNSTT